MVVVEEVTVTVSLTFCVDVMTAGDPTVHVGGATPPFTGAIAQVRFTLPVKPLRGSTKKVVVLPVVAPAVIEIAPLLPTSKSGATVTVTVAVLLLAA